MPSDVSPRRAHGNPGMSQLESLLEQPSLRGNKSRLVAAPSLDGNASTGTEEWSDLQSFAEASLPGGEVPGNDWKLTTIGEQKQASTASLRYYHEDDSLEAHGKNQMDTSQHSLMTLEMQNQFLQSNFMNHAGNRSASSLMVTEHSIR